MNFLYFHMVRMYMFACLHVKGCICQLMHFVVGLICYNAALVSSYLDDIVLSFSSNPNRFIQQSFICRYGSHGFEMINVTYSGDQLVAYKVTGDQNIPRGEISFTADLSPPGYSSSFDHETAVLEPIALSEGSAKKWGTRR